MYSGGFLIQINTIRMAKCRSIRIITYFLKIEFILANKGGPDEMQHIVIFHLGLHCFLESVIVLCFVVHYFMSILVLQSS